MGKKGVKKAFTGLHGGKAFELKLPFQDEPNTFDDRDDIKNKNIAELESKGLLSGPEAEKNT